MAALAALRACQRARSSERECKGGAERSGRAARRAGRAGIAASEGVARDGQGLLGWKRVQWPLGRGSSAGVRGLEARARLDLTSCLWIFEFVSVFTGIVGEVPAMK